MNPDAPKTTAALAKELVDELRRNPLDVQALIDKLRKHTASGELIGPETEHEHTAFETWMVIVRLLWENRLFQQATDVVSAWYDRINQLQEQDHRRYHKGAPAHQLGNCYLALGMLAHAAWFFTLAIIEDVVLERDVVTNPTPATKTLQLRFNWSDERIRSLAAKAKKVQREQPNLCRYPEIVAVHLAREQNLRLPTATGVRNIPINRPFLKLLVEGLENGGSDEKKKALEFLASYLALTLPNVRILPNARTLDYEMDLIVIQHGSEPTYLVEALGRSFLVECKNLERTVGVEQLNHFVAKMRFNRCHCGVIFSREGLSGDKQKQPGLLNARVTQLRWYHQDGCVIIVLAVPHLSELVDGSISFSDLLLRGYESIRFSLPEAEAT